MNQQTNELPVVQTVALDVDEVVSDFISAYLDLAQHLGFRYFPTERNQVKSWDWNGAPIGDTNVLWRHILRYPSFWLNLKPRPEIPQVFGITYVTARPVPSYVTKTWMYLNNIPFKCIYTVEPTDFKTEVFRHLKKRGVKYFADDKPSNFLDAQKVFGDGAFLFDAPHNQDYNAGDRRIFSVYEIPDLAIYRPTAQRMAA